MQTLLSTRAQIPIGTWVGSESEITTNPETIRSILKDFGSECFLLDYQNQIGVTQTGDLYPLTREEEGIPVIGFLRPQSPAHFGNPGFIKDHGLKYAYMAGSMANAISNEPLVIALGKAGFLASFGAGGVSPARLLEAIKTLQDQLPDGPYAFNLIHSPQEPLLEQKVVDYYLQHQVRTIEASAFLRLTPTLVEYRAAGLTQDENGNPIIKNKIIAKISRREVAIHFLNPAPEKMLNSLVNQGKITSLQAEMAEKIPMADDITVEADSGGHTDNRPLTSMLPSIVALRDETQDKNNYSTPVRIGAAGGIGTPTSVLGAFSMGADYIVTGSVNQGCVEAGTSNHVKNLLAQSSATDMMMSPSADMFEMGVKVQVLKRGTMFPMRAQKLFDIYSSHDGIDDIDPKTRQELEEKIFQKKLEEVWDECIRFFSERDPSQLERADGNPKRKMSLIFRWYLGLATHWGVQGNTDRTLDYQIWCGPSMGSFNDWTKGTSLEEPKQRHSVKIAEQLLDGAVYLYRILDLNLQGFSVPYTWNKFLD